jgi:flagellin-like protein
MNGKHARKAISPLVSTLILIAIAIAGGLIVYGAMYSWSGTISSKMQVSVESIDLVKASDTTTFAITIKNSGSKPVDEVKIVLPNGTETSDIVSGTLSPGQTISYSAEMPSGYGVIGQTYTVTVKAKYTSDGSAFTKTVSVQCRS